MDIEIIHLPTVDSTNTWAKQHAHQFSQDKLTIIVADEQTAGRGRFQRSWISPKGENLYATFYFTLTKESMHIHSLAQLMTYSVAQVLLEEDLPITIKWPNDILIQGKKASGILCELSSGKDHIDCFLGVGLNVNTDSKLLSSIQKPATSLQAESDRLWQRQDLLKKIQMQFVKDLAVFKKSGFTSFLSRFENLMAYIGQTVTCTIDSKQITGICHSLTNEGQLNIYLPNKELVTLSAAEVSVSVKK